MVWTDELRGNTENNWQWEDLNTGTQIKISNHMVLTLSFQLRSRKLKITTFQPIRKKFLGNLQKAKFLTPSQNWGTNNQMPTQAFPSLGQCERKRHQNPHTADGLEEGSQSVTKGQGWVDQCQNLEVLSADDTKGVCVPPSCKYHWGLKRMMGAEMETLAIFLSQVQGGEPLSHIFTIFSIEKSLMGRTSLSGRIKVQSTAAGDGTR